MPSTVSATPCRVQSISRAQRLRRFLNAYWLRPENAVWMALRSEVLSQVPWVNPSVDLSCGDGVFSFLHAGGVFDDRFDVFWGAAPQRTAGNHQADIFDYVDEHYRPVVARGSDYRISVGTDLKPNLLTKAGLLDLYEELVVHDNNQPLPFDDGAFETVYCNSVYWTQNVDLFLSEMRRITAKGGKVVLEVKLDSVLDYTLESFRPVLGERFLEIIGRGRAATWPTIADRATWERRFAQAGLSITRAVPFVTRTHAHLWDVGLRPIAPLLVELANQVSPQTRADVKRRWVELFIELCTPFCDPAMDLFSQTSEPAEILYELKQDQTP